MTKSEAMERWENLEENQNYMEHLEAIPYKARGSKYGACGLRIEGKPEFIDAILSHLKPLLKAENGITRLGLSRKTVEPRDDKDNMYADGEHEVCYIRVHERGGEAQRMNLMYGDNETTEQFANMIGA